MGCVFALIPLSLGLAACGNSSRPLSASPYDAAGHLAVKGLAGGFADPERPLEIISEDDGARIVEVSAVDRAGRRLNGEVVADGTRWRSTGPLAAGTQYTVRVSTERDSGQPGRHNLTFGTRPAEGERLKVKFGPESGTYGVGQPITAELSHKVSNMKQRAVVERSLRVVASTGTRGAWHWVDDKTLHYRPRQYWPAHASITVSSALRDLRIRKDLYGGKAKPVRIRTGDRVEAVTDMAKHTMTFKRNGKTIRTIPVTTGKEGFRTRNGIKVILAKEQFVRMRGTSVGIPAGSADSYDLPVYWASRVTWSGEYVHGAPWSVGSQGSANVSHGCTGMSSSNAQWFFEQVRRGDIVKYIGGEGEEMTPFDNGFGDWNLSWQEWLEGSAVPPEKPADRSDVTTLFRPLTG